MLYRALKPSTLQEWRCFAPTGPQVLVRLLKARLKVLLKVLALIRLPKARLEGLLKVLLKLLVRSS